MTVALKIMPGRDDAVRVHDRTTERPLHSEDAERAVLGAIVERPEMLRVVRPLLETDDFASGETAAIYGAMVTLADRGEPVERLALAQAIVAAGFDGTPADWLTTIEDVRWASAAAENAEYYAKLVLHHAKRRRMVDTLESAVAWLKQDTQEPTIVAERLAGALGTLASADAGLAKEVCALHAPPPAPIEWLIADLWTAGDIGILVGDDGSFKSTAALHIAGAVAGGYRVFDRFPTQRRPVLIVSAEDPQDVLALRLEAFIVGHGWNRGRVLENVHWIANPDGCLSDPKWQALLLGAVKRTSAGLVILDPLAELLGGDENSNSDARPVMKFCRRLTQVLGPAKTAVQIVHHMGKAAEGKRDIDRIRGASAIRSASRCTYTFDFTETGLVVRNVKMSRAAKMDPFVLDRRIELSDPQNRASWRSAQLVYQDARTASKNRGEEFILQQLAQRHPVRLTTTELKALATGVPGVAGEDVTIGLRTLIAKGLISSVPGEHNAKLWGLTAAYFTGQTAGQDRAAGRDGDA